MVTKEQVKRILAKPAGIDKQTEKVYQCFNRSRAAYKAHLTRLAG